MLDPAEVDALVTAEAGGSAVLAKQTDSMKLTENAINNVFNHTMKNAPSDDWANWSRYDGGPWADDYGWWGIALARAYLNRKLLGYSDDFAMNILALAKKCLYGLAGCWDPSVAVPNTDITGGAWNHEVTDQALTGRNCVTNEVLWILSHRLFNLTGDKTFSQQNTNSSKFFWLASDADCLYTNGLVRERFKGMLHESVFPGTQNPWYWIGDQGLFIGAYLGNQLMGGDWFDSGTACDIANKVNKQMVDAKLVIHDTLPPDPNFDDDYATGKGAFMRNWVQFNDQRFQQPSNLKALVMINSTYAWINRPWKNESGNRQYQFGFNWNPVGKPYGQGGEPNFPGNTVPPSDFSCLILQTAGLSVMNAVLEVSPSSANEPIESLIQATVP